MVRTALFYYLIRTFGHITFFISIQYYEYLVKVKNIAIIVLILGRYFFIAATTI